MGGVVSDVFGKDQQPPPAPNYQQAAQQTQASQMTPQYTPYGSQVYSADPKSPSGYRSTINLNPQAKGTLDTQMALSRGLAGIANDQLPELQERYSGPLDYKSLSQPAYDAMASRLDPNWNQATTSQETKLVNQGLRPGDEAYDNAMRVFDQGKNDAYQQATLSSLQNAQQFYAQPLNVFNAIRTGAQVQNPQFSAQPGANYGGAAQAQGQYAGDVYNAQVGQQNAMTQGLFGLGGSGMMALALSDRRLKSNIERIGTHPLGIGIYEYDIFDRRERGVMADEVEKVRPQAVVRHPSGYLMVDYGAL